jgi:hypothetical protein
MLVVAELSAHAVLALTARQAREFLGDGSSHAPGKIPGEGMRRIVSRHGGDWERRVRDRAVPGLRGARADLRVRRRHVGLSADAPSRPLAGGWLAPGCTGLTATQDCGLP